MTQWGPNLNSLGAHKTKAQNDQNAKTGVTKNARDPPLPPPDYKIKKLRKQRQQNKQKKKGGGGRTPEKMPPETIPSDNQDHICARAPPGVAPPPWSILIEMQPQGAKMKQKFILRKLSVNIPKIKTY